MYFLGFAFIFCTMNKIILSFLITSFAGFATLFGVIPCFIREKYQDAVISFSLAFSSGVMLAISILSLIPEAILLLSDTFKIIPLFLIVFIFVVVGVLISFLTSFSVDKFVSKNKLYRLGIISIIVLILHNIPEGVTTFISSSVNTTLGVKLAFAIALHNIPEGISIAVPIFYSTNNFKKAFSYTFVAGFSELLGAVLAFLVLAKYVNTFLLAMILALTAGVMMHISIYELLPNSLEYKKNKGTFCFFILGFIVMMICDFLL